MSGSGEQAVNLALPEPGDVLRAIYKSAGNGSSSYDMGDGIWASYWYGHAYKIEGREYFTGFAYNTVAHADESEDSYAGPGDQVSIAQATYVRAPKGSVAVWEFVAAERNIGLFGGYGKANAIDEGLSARTHFTSGGDYFIAVPTWYLETGVRVGVAEIFRFDPQQHRWRYLSNVQTGEDNSAGCADDREEGLPPCAISFGRLTFHQRPREEMPSIQVAKKGKVVDAPNMTRELGPLDAREYFYDKAQAQYQLAR